jgi:zinc protease
LTGAATLALLGALATQQQVAAQGQPAQPPPPSSGVVAKRRAPVSDTLLSVTLPKPHEADLPNGIHLMVLEDRRTPQVSLQLSIRGAGGCYDPVDRAGLAQFTAANMREGTASRSSTRIAEDLDRLSATLSVSAGMSSEDATLAASSLTEHFDVVLDLLADVLLNPTFPEEELARYKTQTRAQLQQQRSQAGFLAVAN